jgi:hypothetical protein
MHGRRRRADDDPWRGDGARSCAVGAVVPLEIVGINDDGRVPAARGERRVVGWQVGSLGVGDGRADNVPRLDVLGNILGAVAFDPADPSRRTHLAAALRLYEGCFFVEGAEGSLRVVKVAHC